MRIILMRHAESTANIDPMIISGVSHNASLTQTGRQHVKDIATKIQRLQLAIKDVYVSPTLRTKQTTQLLLTPDCQAKITIDDRLIELSQGNAEGTRRSDRLTQAALARRADQKKDFHFTNGESMNQAALRLHKWISEVSASSAKNDTILVVTHAMLIRSYVSFLLNWTFEKTLKNELDFCACVIIEIDSPTEPPHVRMFNAPIEMVEE